MIKVIISKYITKRVLTTFLAVFFLLILIVFGNQFFIVSNEGIKIGLYNLEIFQIISLKIIRSLSELIVLSFLMAITISLNRLNKTSEKIIFHANGISNLNIFFFIRSVTFPVVLIVTFLAVEISPWAKNEISIVIKNAQNRPDYLFFKEGQFQTINHNTLFTEKASINEGSQNLENVFLFVDNKKQKNKVVTAKDGVKSLNLSNKNVYLNLSNGNIYDFSSEGNIIRSTKFDNYKTLLYEERNSFSDREDVNENKSIYELVNSGDELSRSEFLYRLLTPLTFPLLIYIAIVITNTHGRSSKNYPIIIIICIYLVFAFLIPNLRSYPVSNWTYFFILGSIMPLITLAIIYQTKLQNFLNKKFA